MISIDAKKKRGWLEEFATVSALYQVFSEGRNSLRTKRAEYRCDEVAALPIDFLMDVDLKARRVLPEPLYQMFLRLAAMGNLDVLPEAAKLLLGKVWFEYGLGVEGSYKTLYFRTKNEQIRSMLKEIFNGRKLGDPYFCAGDDCGTCDCGA